MNNPKISVIICTYHSANEKLKRTIDSISHQQDAEYEVIITDDGSEEFDVSSVESFLKNIKMKTILHHEKNVGTVNNLYSALRGCSGEYVFCISPGDMMYADDTLYRMYQEAVKADEPILFGNAVWYYLENTHIHIVPANEPRMPNLYNQKCKSYFLPQLSYYYTNRPVGVTYFRKRSIFIKYIEMIRKEIKYVEDSTTTLLYLLDGGRIKYLDIPVVWYEYGTGVSTSKNDKWARILEQDFQKLEEIAKKNYSNTELVKCVYGDGHQSFSKSVKYSMLKVLLIFWKKKGKLLNYHSKQANVEHLREQLEGTV